MQAATNTYLVYKCTQNSFVSSLYEEILMCHKCTHVMPRVHKEKEESVEPLYVLRINTCWESHTHGYKF